MTGRILAVFAKSSALIGAVLALALLPIPIGTALAQAPPPPAAKPVAALPVAVKTAQAGASQYLVDGQGRTLYLYTRDDQKTSLSACTSAGCLARWPLLAAAAKPAAGEGVDANLLGTVKHPNGTTMATYNGWPLYNFIEDKAPGDFLGQGSGGIWWTLSARGAGDTGIGPAGATGDAGAKGAVGAKGAAGPAGAAGSAGAAGAKGAKGDVAGKVGAAGPAGAKGAVGAAGAAGAAGATGSNALGIVGIIVAAVAVVVVGAVLMKGRRPTPTS